MFSFVFVFIKIHGLAFCIRSRCGGNSTIAQDTNGNKPIHLRGMQQRVPKGAKLTTPSKRTQPSVEAQAEIHERSEAKGLSLPRAYLRPPRAFQGTRGPHRDQETLLS